MAPRRHSATVSLEPAILDLKSRILSLSQLLRTFPRSMVRVRANDVILLSINTVLCFLSRPNYYHRQQLLRGKHRVARPKRKPWWRSTRYTTSTVVTHSKSDHKHKHNMVPMYHIDGVKGDASSTFQGRVRAGTT